MADQNVNTTTAKPTQSLESKHTKEAIKAVLEEIATDANSLSISLLDAEHDQIALESSTLAIYRNFADKIGWMAEIGLKSLTGTTLIKGDAEDWFLSPCARDVLKKK